MKFEVMRKVHFTFLLFEGAFGVFRNVRFVDFEQPKFVYPCKAFRGKVYLLQI